jgi:hypothetical protein
MSGSEYLIWSHGQFERWEFIMLRFDSWLVALQTPFLDCISHMHTFGPTPLGYIHLKVGILLAKMGFWSEYSRCFVY